MFDGDSAGQNATLKTGQQLLQQGFNVFVIQLPSGMDPDEYLVKHGEDAFNHFVTHEKKTFINFKIHLHQDEIQNNDLAYEKYLKEITQDISYMNSSILRKKYCKKLQICLKLALIVSVNQWDITHIKHLSHHLQRRTYHSSGNFRAMRKQRSVS